MTKFILNGKNLMPLSNLKPRQAVILCHGYGGSGLDISILANNWQRFLPDTIFLCPNAPEICSVNPGGYQWFDLSEESEEKIFEKSLLAEKKLNIYLDQVQNYFNLNYDKIALVGFSQGCMMIIQTALKKKEQVNSIVGYSGRIIYKKMLIGKINSKPNIFLMHGDQDNIVSANYLLESKDFLNQYKIKIKTKIFKNCDHRIPVEGVSLGLEFLKKNIL